MKVTVKKNLIVFHNPDHWETVHKKILAEFGTGMAIQSRMRRELGFSVRNHQAWFKIVKNGHVRKYCELQTHLDFYSESAQSWFQLKYLNLSST